MTHVERFWPFDTATSVTADNNFKTMRVARPVGKQFKFSNPHMLFMNMDCSTIANNVGKIDALVIGSTHLFVSTKTFIARAHYIANKEQIKKEPGHEGLHHYLR